MGRGILVVDNTEKGCPFDEPGCFNPEPPKEQIEIGMIDYPSYGKSLCIHQLIERSKRDGTVIIIGENHNSLTGEYLKCLEKKEIVFTVTARPELNSFSQLPKLNCKKGHNYTLVEEKKEGLLIIQVYKCRCGKEL